ncbi:MAG: glycosyltransferase family 4 protein [Rhizobiaceae bacterium]
MRVAYLSADCGIPVFGSKGASVHIQEMVHAMRQQDADVRVVATRLGNPSAEHNGAIHAFKPRVHNVKDGGDEAREEANIADAEAAREALVSLYAEWPFDMIYERYSLWSDAGVRAARALGVPLMVEVNAPMLLEQEQYRRLQLHLRAQEIERAVFGQADGLVCVSSAVRDYAISKGARPGRAIVMGNAVDTARFHAAVPPMDFGMPKGAYTIGFSGSLKRWHGVDVMMDAFRIVLRAAPHARLLVVGEGPERGWIEGFARGAGIEHAVTMAGWLGHPEMPAALTAMDVALAPYPETEDFYFSPLKVFEYLAAGRPIVASRIGQIAEVIKHEDTGILTPPGNAEALAEAVLGLMADPPLMRRLSEAAALEGARHSWGRNASQALAMGQQLRKAA